MSSLLHFDIETFSEASVIDVGAAVHARHPSTRITVIGWSLEVDGEAKYDPLPEDYLVKQWDESKSKDPPEEILAYLRDPEQKLAAWNKTYEQEVVHGVWGIWIPDERWVDPMVWATYQTRPAALLKAGVSFGLGEKLAKKDTGQALLNLFCGPVKPSKVNNFLGINNYETHPEKWASFLEYNAFDVKAQRACYDRLKQHHIPKSVWREYLHDQDINHRGIPVNYKLALAADKLLDKEIEALSAELMHLTGIDKVNSVQQLLAWVKERGYPFGDMRASTIKEVLASEGVNSQVRRALVLRQQLSRSSVKKIKRFVPCTVQEDMTVKHTLKFSGASRTHRWSGYDIQPHNLSSPTPAFKKKETLVKLHRHVQGLPYEYFKDYYGDEVMDALSAVIRGLVQAPKDHLICDADLSAIEYVVLGYLTKDPVILDIVKTGKDPYAAFAPSFLGMSYEEVMALAKGGDKSFRNLCKPPVLGCGYGLGPGNWIFDVKKDDYKWTGLMGYSEALGVQMTKDQAQKGVDAYKALHVGVTKFWDLVEEAFKRAIRGQSLKLGDWLKMKMVGGDLVVILPSGSRLFYRGAHIIKEKDPYGRLRDKIVYTEAKTGGKDMLSYTYFGKLTENIVQAVARDILMDGIRRARKAGLDVFMHVHDQVLCSSHESTAARDLEILKQCMSKAPKWQPDMVLNTDGFTNKFFMKD